MGRNELESSFMSLRVCDCGCQGASTHSTKVGATSSCLGSCPAMSHFSHGSTVITCKSF